MTNAGPDVDWWDCDWCGAEEEDMEVYTVSDGDEFICEDCHDRLTEAAPELLHALEQATAVIYEAERVCGAAIGLKDTCSHDIAGMCDSLIAKVRKGDGG